MSETKKRYGYTGKGLRVNLTTGKFTVEPTFPRFNGLIGGTAFGYRVLWDEVPPDTDCYSPENKVVIAPGPLSGPGSALRHRRHLFGPHRTHDALADFVASVADCERARGRRNRAQDEVCRLGLHHH